MSDWQCEQCTLINSHISSVCGACGKERRERPALPNQYPAAAVRSMSPVRSSYDACADCGLPLSNGKYCGETGQPHVSTAATSHAGHPPAFVGAAAATAGAFVPATAGAFVPAMAGAFDQQMYTTPTPKADSMPNAKWRCRNGHESWVEIDYEKCAKCSAAKPGLQPEAECMHCHRKRPRDELITLWDRYRCGTKGGASEWREAGGCGHHVCIGCLPKMVDLAGIDGVLDCKKCKKEMSLDLVEKVGADFGISHLLNIAAVKAKRKEVQERQQIGGRGGYGDAAAPPPAAARPPPTHNPHYKPAPRLVRMQQKDGYGKVAFHMKYDGEWQAVKDIPDGTQLEVEYTEDAGERWYHDEEPEWVYVKDPTGEFSGRVKKHNAPLHDWGDGKSRGKGKGKGKGKGH